MRPQTDDFAAEGDDRTFVGPVKAGDQMEARRLTRAVWPDQRNGFIFVDRKAQVLNGAQPAESFAEVADDKRFSHRSRPVSPAVHVQPIYRRSLKHRSDRPAAIESRRSR